MTPIDGVGADIASAFSGGNVALYVAAVAATDTLALDGGDHGVRVLVRTHVALPAWGDAANLGGYILPVVIAPAVWIGGLVSGDDRTLGAGSAAVQALALTAAATVLLKWSTGRPYPLHGGDPHAPDVLAHPEYAREVSPFNLTGAWAWPSGHTSAMTSIVAALSNWDPTCLVIPLVGYPLSAAIGLGMIIGDHHWTSDVVAGGILGYAVGSSVGRGFRLRATHDARNTASLRVIPLGPGIAGGALAGDW